MDTNQVRQIVAKALYEAGLLSSEDGNQDGPENCSPSLTPILDFICNNPMHGKSDRDAAIYWTAVLTKTASVALEKLADID